MTVSAPRDIAIKLPIPAPGGTVEVGELAIDAACQELGEETSLIERSGFRRLGDSHHTFEQNKRRQTFTAHISFAN